MGQTSGKIGRVIMAVTMLRTRLIQQLSATKSNKQREECAMMARNETIAPIKEAPGYS
jgi:hypothetical protein